MVIQVATTVAPELASQSAAVAGQLIPFGVSSGLGWLNTAMRAAHMMDFYLSCLYNYDLVTKRPVQFGIGAALYSANNCVLREIARFALAARLVIKCIDDGKKLIKQAGKIATAFKCTFPIPTHYLKTKGQLDRQNPEAVQHLASNFSFLPEAALTAVLKTEQIVTTTSSFGWGCFCFLPNLLRIGQVLSFDTATEMNAFAGLIDNAEVLLDRLTNNRDQLSDEIEKNRDTFAALLETTKSPYKVEELYEFVARSKLPARAKRIIREVRDVTVDSALSFEYALTGSLSRPLSHASRTIQQVPVVPPRQSAKRYAHDDLTLTHSTRQTSAPAKQL